MIDHVRLPNKPIACIDLVSFYASCIAVLHNLDPRKVPIAVVGNLNRPGSVTLAASPAAKKLGIKTGTRYYEFSNRKDICVFEPKMRFFMDMSVEVTKILLKYLPPEAISVYSIDESFLDLSHVSKLWGEPEVLMKRIQAEIYETLQLRSTVGMGPNILLSKLALDLEAKKSGFARWTYDDVPTKLWPVSPLSEMWGIGSRIEKSLNALQIYSVEDLAKADLKILEKKFGILGNQLFHHAWGIDLSEIGNPYITKNRSFGKSQVLMRDYNTLKEVKVVLLEMCEDVSRRARDADKVGRTISLSIGYSKHSFENGFSRARTIEVPTNDTMRVYEVCLELLNVNYLKRPVRQIAVSISKLETEHSVQLDLFSLDSKNDLWKRRKLALVMDGIRSKYGSTALLRAVSLSQGGTAITRSKTVGGHKE